MSIPLYHTFFCPSIRGWGTSKCYKDTWMFAPEYRQKIGKTTLISEFEYLGIPFIVEKSRILHSGCNKQFDEYELKTKYESDRYYCCLTFGYEFRGE